MFNLNIMAKVGSSVTKLVKEPITTVKKGMKTALKPADPSGTGAVFVGAVLSAPIGYLYSKGFDALASRFPSILKDTILGKVIKFGFPLLPIYFVKRFKVPFGNLINGTLLGIFVMQIVMEVWGLVRGKKETVVNEGDIVIANNKYAEWD